MKKSFVKFLGLLFLAGAVSVPTGGANALFIGFGPPLTFGTPGGTIDTLAIVPIRCRVIPPRANHANHANCTPRHGAIIRLERAADDGGVTRHRMAASSATPGTVP